MSQDSSRHLVLMSFSERDILTRDTQQVLDHWPTHTSRTTIHCRPASKQEEFTRSLYVCFDSSASIGSCNYVLTVSTNLLARFC